MKGCNKSIIALKIPTVLGFVSGGVMKIYGFNGKIKIKSPTLKRFFRIGLAMK